MPEKRVDGIETGKRFVGSLVAVAEHFGVSVATVRKWRDINGCNLLKDKPYDLVAIEQWLDDRANQRIAGMTFRKLKVETENAEREGRDLGWKLLLAAIALGIAPISREVRGWFDLIAEEQKHQPRDPAHPPAVVHRSQRLVRIPLSMRSLKGFGTVYRIRFPLFLRDSSGKFGNPHWFQLDTGADFTTIPEGVAHRLGLPIKSNPGSSVTASGSNVKHHFTSLWFSFPDLPSLQFRSDCHVVPEPLKKSLFSLRDLVPHFLLRSRKADALHPHGSIVLQLRNDHSGERRG